MFRHWVLSSARIATAPALSDALVIARRIVDLRHLNPAGNDHILKRVAASHTGFSGRLPQPRRK
jgi:hypothetical protein